MKPSDLAALRAREIKEQSEIAASTITLRRDAFVQAMNMAADVMQNSAAVAKSDAWKIYYHTMKKNYRETANAVSLGARFAIKE